MVRRAGSIQLKQNRPTSSHLNNDQLNLLVVIATIAEKIFETILERFLLFNNAALFHDHFNIMLCGI